MLEITILYYQYDVLTGCIIGLEYISYILPDANSVFMLKMLVADNRTTNNNLISVKVIA